MAVGLWHNAAMPASTTTPGPVDPTHPGWRGRVDLNADLGEEVTDDEGLLTVVTSANVACGFHAGTATTMREVCARAAELGVRIGAQVSYDDRATFGRVARDVPARVLADQVASQVQALRHWAEAAGTRVEYVKPHGALYHRVIVDPDQAAAVLAGSDSLPVLGMGGEFARQAAAAGRQVWHEGFPDRGYTEAGLLVPRDQPGALVTDSAAIVAQAAALAGRVDSLCLHGDSPGAVAHARAVRAALLAEGWRLAPVGSR